jgi:hypothetical protein
MRCTFSDVLKSIERRGVPIDLHRVGSPRRTPTMNIRH